MAHVMTAAASTFATFGISATVKATPPGGSIDVSDRPWIITQLSVTTAGGVAELSGSDGLTVARTYYNRASSSGKSPARHLSMTVIVVAASEGAANSANVALLPGTVLTVTCASHPDAADSWELQSMDVTGSNTEHTTYSITALRSVAAT